MRGYIRWRHGSWEIFVDYGRDEVGKRQRETKTVHGSKRDAQRTLRDLLSLVDAGVRRSPSKQNVGEHLQRWLDSRIDVERGTWERYAGIVKRNLLPAFGQYSFSTLTPQIVQNQYARWLSEGRQRGNGGYSPATIKKIHLTFRAALAQAVADGHCVRNAAAHVRLPKLQSTESRALEPSECARLLKAARMSRLHAPIVFGLATGLRRGELLALRWSDVNLEAGRVKVREALELTNEHGIRFKAPKTDKVRIVELPASAISELRAHRVEQENHRALRSAVWDDNDLVFPDRMGRPQNPSTFSMAFRRLAHQAGLGWVGPKALRHTHTTMMLGAGIHPKIAADRLGHATTRMTLDVYSHVQPAMQSEAAAIIDAVLRKDFGQQLVSMWPKKASGAKPQLAGKAHGGKVLAIYPRRNSNPCHRLERAVS